ncbi:MAG: TolC family protein [Henriciella sp.]|nr:TolC family protein [Henriciella sp.]
MLSKTRKTGGSDGRAQTFVDYSIKGLFLAVMLGHVGIVNAQSNSRKAPASTDADLISTAAPLSQGCTSFETALMLSVERSPNVSASSARVDRAQSEATIARSLSRPQLSVFGRTQTGDGGLTGNALENQIGLRASQRIFDFGDARFARDASKARINSAMESRLSVKTQTVRQTALSYLSALEALARLDIIKDRETFFQKLLVANQSALENGYVTRSQVAAISANLADAQAERIEFEFLIDRFTHEVAIDIDEPMAICAGQVPSFSFSELEFDDTDVEAALFNNPDIKRANEDVDALDSDRKRERLNRTPVIEAVGITSYSYIDQRNEWEYRDRIGVDVSVPLFSGSALSARVRGAEADLSRARFERDQIRRDLYEDITLTHRDLLSIWAQYERRKHVEAMQLEKFEAAQLEFESGMKTLPDLIEDRLEYEQSRLVTESLKYERLRQQVNLMALTGRLLD